MKKSLLVLSSLWASVTYGGLEAEFGSYSNFIWRGVTFSENRPAVQATLDAQNEKGFYLGGFVSNAEFSDEALGPHAHVTHETDLSVGKRWVNNRWEIQVSYNRFMFPGAGVYDCDEFNLFLNYERFILELSYMDDYFGGQSNYRYIRFGHEWSYSKTIGATFFAGFNSFTSPHGGIKSRCLNVGCTDIAQTTRGAGNNDYVDLYLTHRKIIDNYVIFEFSLNWTNREIYSAQNNQISKQRAKDFAAIVGITLPFKI